MMRRDEVDYVLLAESGQGSQPETRGAMASSSSVSAPPHRPSSSTIHYGSSDAAYISEDNQEDPVIFGMNAGLGFAMEGGDLDSPIVQEAKARLPAWKWILYEEMDLFR
jgi:hypothetical protein